MKRFIEAQEKECEGYQQALNEIRNGQKKSCWMWYIFPQIAGLGTSTTSRYYAIKNLEEAREYINHPVLGGRLKEISEVLLTLETDDAVRVFGTIDAKKLQSSMTLFDYIECHAESGCDLFKRVLIKYFQGSLDYKTIKLLDIDRDSETKREENGGIEKDELLLPRTLEDFKRELSTGLRVRPRIPSVPMEMVKEVTGVNMHARWILEPMDEWLIQQKKEIVKNADKLKKEIYANAEASYIEKITPLIDELRSVIVEQKEKESYFLAQLEEAKIAFIISRNSLFKRHVEEEAYEAYLDEIVKFYRYKANVAMYEQMLDVCCFVVQR